MSRETRKVVDNDIIASEEQLLAAERQRINERRRLLELSEWTEVEQSGHIEVMHGPIGLAFSGGGIRSATFNLGLLQAIKRTGTLRGFDYLSTVSGGGYIGSALTWFMSYLGGGFPFGTTRADHDGDAGKVVAWLRNHSSYLTPGQGLDSWSLTAGLMRGTLINMLLLLPVLFFAIYLFAQRQGPADILPEWMLQWFPLSLYSLGFGYILLLGVNLLLGLVVAYIGSIFFSTMPSTKGYFIRRRYYITIGQLLRFGVIFTVIGTIPLVYDLVHSGLFHQWAHSTKSFISASGVFSIVIGWRGRKQDNETGGWRQAAINIGLAVVIYALILWLYEGALIIMAGQDDWLKEGLQAALWLGVPAAIILAAFVVDINHVSISRYYRDRLVEAFMYPLPDHEGKRSDPNSCYLRDIKQTTAPYHIINTTIHTPASADPKLRLRGGDNFIFSPLYSGSMATGYAKTSEYLDGTMDLGMAYAISGAAVDPNTGSSRSLSLAFVMVLLNLQLGSWVRNPARPPGKLARLLRLKPLWYYYTLREISGFGMDEKRQYVRLSDGGHFENLALYELLRRRCRVIVCSDAGEDQQRNFEDLAMIIEKARTDFGVEIDIDVSKLRPEPTSQVSPQAYAMGKLRYPAAQGQNAFQGTIMYIKPSIISGLGQDLYSYWQQHPSFPQESTADQFFDEAQFEAYRELGYQLGKLAMSNEDIRALLLGEFALTDRKAA